MSFTDIKTKSQGFTIVELLIVVVVIAILAAITIVSYNGITAKANSSAAASLAGNVSKKAEVYNADDSTTGYPATLAALNNSSKPYYLVASTGTPNSTNGKTTVRYIICGTGSADTAPTAVGDITNITGVIVNYYDFANSRITAVTAGNVSGAAATATNPAGVSTGQITGLVGTKNIACWPTAT